MSDTDQVESRKGDVSLHIERLVLDGLPFTAVSAARLEREVQTELTRLLTEDGLTSTNAGATRSLAAPGFQFTEQRSPVDLGQKIARSVYDSLKQNT